MMRMKEMPRHEARRTCHRAVDPTFYSVHAPFTPGGGIPDACGGTPAAGAPANAGSKGGGAIGCIMAPALTSAGATRRVLAVFQQHLSAQQRPVGGTPGAGAPANAGSKGGGAIGCIMAPAL